MKKTVYMKPEVQVVSVATEHLLGGGSDTRLTTVSGLDAELENGGDDPGDFSRRHGGNIWDDDTEIDDGYGY